MVHLSGSRVWDENSGEEEEGMMLAEPPGVSQVVGSLTNFRLLSFCGFQIENYDFINMFLLLNLTLPLWDLTPNLQF